MDSVEIAIAVSAVAFWRASVWAERVQTHVEATAHARAAVENERPDSDNGVTAWGLSLHANGMLREGKFAVPDRS